MICSISSGSSVAKAISSGSSVAKAIQTEQHNYQQRKSYKKSEQNVLAKARKPQQLFDLYEKL